MKKYHIGTDVKYKILFFLTGYFFIMFIFAIIFASHSTQAIWLPFLALAVVIILASVSLFFFNCDKRNKEALTGKLKTAKVIKIVLHESAYTAKVHYIYKNEHNEKCIGIFKMNCSDAKDYFKVGLEFPVYVKGEFATINLDEIRHHSIYSEPFVVVEKKEEIVSKKIRCEYCDSRYDEKLDKCPNCGARNSLK